MKTVNKNSAVAMLPVILWALLLSVVVFGIIKKDKIFKRQKISIAVIKIKDGDVKVRGEDEAHWLPVSVNKRLIDGDRISSSANSKARVSFGNAREITLGEDTVVQLSSIKRGRKNIAFIVELAQGAMSARVGKKCKGCPSIVVKSEDKSYNLLKNKTIGLYRPKDSYTREFKPSGPWPGSKNTRSNPLNLKQPK